MTNDTLVIHTRLPRRLIALLDHEAIDRNLYRAEMLAEILETHFGIVELEKDVENFRQWMAAGLIKENPA